MEGQVYNYNLYLHIDIGINIDIETSQKYLLFSVFSSLTTMCLMYSQELRSEIIE